MPLEYLLKEEDDDCISIDSFILSCRAMGRGIESAIMNHLKKHVDKNKYKALKAIYIPTKKNIPVSNFYDEQKFELSEENENGNKKYLLQLPKIEMVNCSWISII